MKTINTKKIHDGVFYQIEDEGETQTPSKDTSVGECVVSWGWRIESTKGHAEIWFKGTSPDD